MEEKNEERKDASFQPVKDTELKIVADGRLLEAYASYGKNAFAVKGLADD